MSSCPPCMASMNFSATCKKAKTGGKPFFVWLKATRMHNFTHVKAENRTSGLGAYADGMIEHDKLVGQVLDYLDQEKLTENTIVIYTSDNGPMVCL